MTIVREARRRRFTTIANEGIEDARLSFRARGVLVYLLSKPDDWRTTSTQLAAATTEGRDAIRAALRELETAGYLERTKRRTAGGQWCTETVVHESPGHTGDGKPGVGEPGVGAPGPIAKTETKDGSPKETNALPAAEADGQGALPGLPPPAPSKAKAPNPNASAASALVRRVCDTRTPKPTASFRNLMGLAARLLDAGHAETDVERAFMETPAFTLAALEFQLNGRGGRRNGQVKDAGENARGRMHEIEGGWRTTAAPTTNGRTGR